RPGRLRHQPSPAGSMRCPGRQMEHGAADGARAPRMEHGAADSPSRRASAGRAVERRAMSGHDRTLLAVGGYTPEDAPVSDGPPGLTTWWWDGGDAITPAGSANLASPSF